MTLSPRASKARDSSFPNPDLDKARQGIKNQRPINQQMGGSGESIRSSSDEPDELVGHCSKAER